jgi:hypothetical protein
MTAKFLKSDVDALPFRFADAVSEYIEAMDAHKFTVGIAAPIHHRMVQAAVRRVQYEDQRPDDFVADYEIIDDTPPLWMRKRNLVELVERNEEEVANKVWPVALRRLEIMEYEDMVGQDNLTNNDRKRLDIIISKQKKMQELKRKTAHVLATIDVLDETNIGLWTFDLEV